MMATLWTNTKLSIISTKCVRARFEISGYFLKTISNSALAVIFTLAFVSVSLFFPLLQMIKTR